MTGVFRTALYAAALILGAGAASAAGLQVQEVDPATLQTDGTVYDLALPGAGNVHVGVQPVRIGPKKVCGVLIGKRLLTTMGAGPTEAYSCVRLRAIGPLPPQGGFPRIGLLYEVASPNAAFNTAVIVQQRSGYWSVDEASLGTYDDTPAAQSLDALAKAVR